MAANPRKPRRRAEHAAKRGATMLAAVLLASTAPPLFGEGSGPATGDAAAAAARQAAVAGTAQLVATVEAIDAARRAITLKGTKGHVQTLGVSDDVRNLPQVKVGERVVVTYTQALALQLTKGGARPSDGVERERAARDAPGERPAGAPGRQVTVVADVVAVNYVKQTVTLRGPGQTVTLAVPDAVQLKSITTGDQVQAIYAEAFAVALKAVPRGAGGE